MLSCKISFWYSQEQNFAKFSSFANFAPPPRARKGPLDAEAQDRKTADHEKTPTAAETPTFRCAVNEGLPTQGQKRGQLRAREP